MDCPKYGGSAYYNYKGYHSTILMAICDAKYKFLYVDIGHYGKDNDASVFGQSEVYSMFDNKVLPLPEPESLAGKDVPYYLVGDKIFPLKQWLQKPYGGRDLSERQRIYNYRISRARRTIENAFGVLSARWRIFHCAIRADVQTVDLIVKAAIGRHNYLLCTENAHYIPSGFVDSESSNDMREGDWRKQVNEFENPALAEPQRLAARNYTFEAKSMRDHLCTYVNSEEGAVEWQINHVRSCGPVLQQI